VVCSFSEHGNPANINEAEEDKSPSERQKIPQRLRRSKDDWDRKPGNSFQKANEDIKNDQCQFFKRGRQQTRQQRNLLLKGSEWGVYSN
jgi:hypothetical protein